MAHELSIRANGSVEAVLGFGEIPWWNSATMPAIVLNEAIPFESLFGEEGLFSWVAEVEQLQYADGSLSSQHGIRRSDTKYELGVHSSSYGLIQPRKLFDFCAAFFQENNVPISSAIAMRGGKVLNITARLGSIDVLGSGDIHKSYLSFCNSFDGSMKARVYKSYIQAICMNTTVAGIASADFSMIYKHSRHVEKRIEADSHKAHSLMLAQQATDEKVKAVLEALAQRKPTRQAYETILDELFGKGDTARTKNVKAEVTQLVAQGVNAQAFPDFKGTGYGIYTALTDYSDHFRPVRLTNSRGSMTADQIRAETALIGDGASFKTEALNVLEKVLVLADGTCESSPYTSLPAATPRYLPSVDERYVSVTDATTGYAEGFDRDAAYDMSLADNESLAYDASSVDTSDVLAALYTTCEPFADLPGTSTDSIVLTLPSGVQVRRVLVPESNLNAQKAYYRSQECLGVTELEWNILGKPTS